MSPGGEHLDTQTEDEGESGACQPGGVEGLDVDEGEGFDVDRLDVEGFDVEGLGVEGFDIDGFVVDSELLIPSVDEFDVIAVVSLVDSVAVDSDWAGCRTTRKSTSGCVIELLGCPIHAFSRTQGT